MSRLTPGMMTVALFALMLGLGGAYVVRHHLATAVPPIQPAPPEQASRVYKTVPVALTDLSEGRVLSINDIGIHEYATEEEYRKSRHAKTSHLTAPSQIAGRRLKAALVKGSSFGLDDLYPFGDTPGIEDRLQAGYRAVTIPIQDVGVVQGFARPGSFVDVLFRAESVEDRPEITLTLFERVEILALNSNVELGQATSIGPVGNVTMAVTPHQAKVLKVVEGRGEISLVLRNPKDDFQFMPFDPGMERGLSNIGDAQFMPASFPNAAANTATKRAEADRIGADRIGADGIGGIDRVIGNASERVTMDDLLGMSSTPSKKTMDIYLGASKTTLEFEETNDELLESLRRGGIISTPIVDRPFRRPQPLGTAHASPKTAANNK
jgi:Flp pilus assembly protein CpaB